MRKQDLRFFTLIIALVLLLGLVACNTADEPTDDSNSAETPTVIAATESYPAPVDAVEILIMESFPVQINVIATGTLPDGCSSIDVDNMTQTLTDNTFTVTVEAVRPADVGCTAEAVPFQQIISLNVTDLPAGSYTVDVNGQTAGFTLDVDNTLQEAPTATPEPPTPTPTPETGSSTVSGIVWHDLCTIYGEGESAFAGDGCVTTDTSFRADGALAAGEPGLEGVVVSLYAGTCPGGELLATTTTDPDGSYTFAQLKEGTYCVTIGIQDDPNATLLLPGEWTSPEGTAAPGSISIDVADDSAVGDIDFGWDYAFLPEPDIVENAPDCSDTVSFLADITIPDDSPFEPGTEFIKTWSVVNAGSCNWGPGYQVAYVGGEQMEAPDAVPITAIVRPGETTEFSVPLTAPAEPGFYRSEWQLRTPSGTLLGLDDRPAEVLWTQIEVVEPGTLASVTGFMWEDLCDQSAYVFGGDLPNGCTLNENGTVRGDSVFDSAEPVMPGVIITLGSGECGTAETIGVTTTDEQGIYRFDGLVPGTYCVFVDVIEEGNFEFLWPGTFTFPAPGKAGTTINPIAGDEIRNINFAWDRADETEEATDG
ncbi:MAG: NBR1-Ig-like domain-containing protein [Anaerolineae bacterium]|nr:NBR1-Ig-like domain-containing protein [Anaerolineae bacterium]